MEFIESAELDPESEAIERLISFLIEPESEEQLSLLTPQQFSAVINFFQWIASIEPWSIDYADKIETLVIKCSTRQKP